MERRNYFAIEHQTITFPSGLTVTSGLDDDGQPYVVIDTEGLKPEFRYDDATGLRGTARPYKVERDGESCYVVGPGGGRVAHHFGVTPFRAGIQAQDHANLLNKAWLSDCGMPIVSVSLNDATLYDAEDHNPALREEAKTDA